MADFDGMTGEAAAVAANFTTTGDRHALEGT